MNKPVLFLATFITVIALVLLGGLIYTWNDVGATASGKIQAVDPGAQPATSQDSTADGSVQQSLQEREAAYQKTIEEANNRIQELQRQLEAAQQQSQTTSAVTPEQAAQIAANFLGQGNIFSVENANIAGVGAYKVNFSSGETIYVSLNGAVISVQMPVAPIFGREHEQDDHD
jgi:TolA-binding protein